jgi:hypothetical protein
MTSERGRSTMDSSIASLDAALRKNPIPLDDFAKLGDEQQRIVTRVCSLVGGFELLTDEVARENGSNATVDARTDALVETLNYVSPAALEGLTGAPC